MDLINSSTLPINITPIATSHKITLPCVGILCSPNINYRISAATPHKFITIAPVKPKSLIPLWCQNVSMYNAIFIPTRTAPSIVV